MLYISYDGLTDPLGQSQVLPYLIHLSQLNYEITILSTEKEENFLKNESVITKICADVQLKWEYITYTKKPPVISTWNDVQKLKRTAKRLYKQHGFKIIHCRSYIAALVGLWMKKQFSVKFLFDMRGFWADERIDGGIWNLNKPIFKKVYDYFKKKEQVFLQKADAVVSLTQNAEQEIYSWDYMQDYPKKIKVIPCCADLNHFNFEKVVTNAALKNKLGIPTQNKVITYLGSIGTWYMMEEMLDYFQVHLQKYPESTFLWITKDDPNLILTAAKSRGIENNVVIHSAERNELPQLLSICDASIFFIKPLFSKKASSPTKMAELLGMGIPLICNTNVGDTDGIVRTEKVGIVVDEFTTGEYQCVVDQFDELISIPKTHLRKVAQEHFSLTEGVNRYREVYDGLI